MDASNSTGGKRRIAEYFIVAGLPANPKPYDFAQVCRDSEDIVMTRDSDTNKLDFTRHPEPIVDIAVVNYQQHETVPPGYTIIDRSYTGAYKADLNGFSAHDEMYICYRRGRDKPPITDIGVIFAKGKQNLRENAFAILHTVGGLSANVNNSTANAMYLSACRAPSNAPVDMLAVTDMCIILTNKGEQCPPAFNRLDQCFNENFLGHRVYLCYKKSVVKQHVLSYEPSLLFRYPQIGTMDRHDDPADTENVARFCLPWGATIESWEATRRNPLPTFFTFVLTNERSQIVYGAAMQFYERFHDDLLLNEDQRAKLLLPPLTSKGGVVGENEVERHTHTCKAICLLSRWPFFEAFKRFLNFLYQLVFKKSEDFKDLSIIKIPLERYIYHFMHAVPFPTSSMPNVLVQISETPICFQLPEESFNMTGGEAFYQLVSTLKVDHIVYLLLYMLTQQSILITSLLPSRLTEIGEALRSMIFPLQWTAPYAPFMYLGMIPVVQAFTPFLFGVDTRFFDFFHLPEHIGCLDLDTGTVRPPTRPGQPALDPKMLPKKPLKILRSSLEALIVDNTQNRELRRRRDFTESDEFKMARRKSTQGLRVKECFLRFMAHLLKDYKQYRPNSEKDPFKTEDFLNTVERSSRPFYRLLLSTQMWNSFIYERLYPTTRTDALAYFDRCVEIVKRECDTVPLMHIDKVIESEHTKVIGPPMVLEDREEEMLEEIRSRGTFPTQLKLEMLYSVPASTGGGNLSVGVESMGSLGGSQMLNDSQEVASGSNQFLNSSLRSDRLTESLSGSLNTLDNNTVPLAQRRIAMRRQLRRTKWEIEETRRIGMIAKHSSNPRAWSLHLYVTCCELWFVTLPAHIRWLMTTCGGPSNSNEMSASLTADQEVWLHHLIRACVRMLYQLRDILKMGYKLGRHASLSTHRGSATGAPLLPPSPTSAEPFSPTGAPPNAQKLVVGGGPTDEVDWARLPDELPSRILLSLLAQFGLYSQLPESTGAGGSQWRAEDVETMTQNVIESILFEYTYESHRGRDVDSSGGSGRLGATTDSLDNSPDSAGQDATGDGNSTSDAVSADNHLVSPSEEHNEVEPPTPMPTKDTNPLEPSQTVAKREEAAPPPVVHRIHRFNSRRLRRYCSMGPGDVMNVTFFQRRPSDTGVQSNVRCEATHNTQDAVADRTGYLPTAGLLLSSLVPGSRSTYYHHYPMASEHADEPDTPRPTVAGTHPHTSNRPPRPKSNLVHDVASATPGTGMGGSQPPAEATTEQDAQQVDSQTGASGSKNSRPNTLLGRRSLIVERTILNKPRENTDKPNPNSPYSTLPRGDSSSSVASASTGGMGLLSRLGESLSSTAGGLLGSFLMENLNNATYQQENYQRVPVLNKDDPMNCAESDPNRISEDSLKRTGSLRFMSPSLMVKNVRSAIGLMKPPSWLGKAVTSGSPNAPGAPLGDAGLSKGGGTTPLQSVMPWSFTPTKGNHSLNEENGAGRERAATVNTPSMASTPPNTSSLSSFTKRNQLLSSTGSGSQQQQQQSSSWSLNNSLFAPFLDTSQQQGDFRQDGEEYTSDEYSEDDTFDSDTPDLAPRFAMQKLSKEKMEQQLINVWNLTSRQVCQILHCFPRGVAPASCSTSTSSPTTESTEDVGEESPNVIATRHLKVWVHLMFFSCSMCSKCEYWIHDEEIMNEWTPDLSNMNTRCPQCHASTVPHLTIRIILQTPNVSSPSSGEGGQQPHHQQQQQPWGFCLVDEQHCVYLSPFVLRKEMESVVLQEGDEALCDASFASLHNILYWNMLWYSHRIGLPTHMLQFVLPLILNKLNEPLTHSNHIPRTVIRTWQDHLRPFQCAVYMHTRWDSPGIRARASKPLYEILRQWQGEMSSQPSGSVTMSLGASPRHPPLAVRVAEQIVRHIRANDMDKAVRDLLHFRLSDHAATLKQDQMLPLYRNIYYLVFTQLDNQSIDALAFFHCYRNVFHSLPQRNHVQPVDRPLRTSALWCHLVFRDLEL